MRHKMTFSHFSKGFIRPNLEEESGCEPTFMFQSFKFHVSIHFVPLSQGDEEQSSGGGMFLRSSLPALFYIPPSASPYPTSHWGVLPS